VPTFESVLRDALELSPADRERLIANVVDTLDADRYGYERAWDEELQARIDELEAGNADLVDWAETKKLIFDRR
jgi:putative addiction module component (TIGR02574 family)